MIVRVKGGVRVKSEKGKNLSRVYPDTKAGRRKAHVRLGQIEAFKRRKGK